MEVLFSVITINYNRCHFLPAIAESLMMQGMPFGEFEWLICDNCSTDNTAKVVEDLISEYPDINIRFVRNDVNRNAGGNRNLGFRESRGKWLLFCDADDTLAENALKQLKDVMEKYPSLDMLECEWVKNYVDEKRTEAHCYGNSEDVMSGREYVLTQAINRPPYAKVFNKDFLNRHNLRYVENDIFEDGDFSLRAYAAAERMKYVPIAVVNYSIYEASISHGLSQSFNKMCSFYRMSMRIKEQAIELSGRDPELGKAVMAQHQYTQYNNFRRYLWHLKRKEIEYILTNYPTHIPSPYKFAAWINDNPKKSAWFLTIMKPFLAVAKNIIKP